MEKQQQPTPIEQVLTEYIIENAHLRIHIKELEVALAEKRKEVE